MSNENLIKKNNIQEVAEKGAKIYDRIKSQYEPQKNGQFLAIEVKSREVYLAKTSSEAVELARLAYPNRVFYVVKIGSSAAETLASLLGKE